ncbi:hypothetical protein [Citrobacter sp. R56]|nr:hypothetical protein [Citrobacter sp. R56]QRG80221.1 hypothetical protein JM656_05810 [Citrobacter sp. R56]
MKKPILTDGLFCVCGLRKMPDGAAFLRPDPVYGLVDPALAYTSKSLAC